MMPSQPNSMPMPFQAPPMGGGLGTGGGGYGFDPSFQPPFGGGGQV